MKNVFLALLTISLLGVSCQKDDTPANPPVEPPIKFMSLTAGSTWNYESTDNTLTTTTPYTLTSTSKDSAIAGKNYHVFANSSGSGNEYYNITGNDYYNFQSLPAALGDTSVEYLYLKDNAAAGATWIQSYAITVTGFPLNVTLTNTVTEKGISKTVKGKSYDNVIHITTALTVTIAGLPLPAGALNADIQTFYAPGVGMIQSVNKIVINFSGVTENTDQQINLVSSDIK